MGILKTALAAPRKFFEQRAIYKATSEFLAGASSQSQIMTGKVVKPDVDINSLIEEYKAWVYIAANRNAQATAKGTLRIYATTGAGEQAPGARFGRKIGHPITTVQRKGLEKKKWFNESPLVKQAVEVEEIEEHPINELLQNVNDHNNAFDLYELLSLYMDITGDAYWLIVKNALGIPEAIYTLPSQWVTIVPDKNYKKFVKGYLFGSNKANQVFLSPDEVIHFKLPHLKNPWSGMGRVEGAIWAVAGYRSMEEYEKYLTDNHGIQDFLINYKNGTLDYKKRRSLAREFAIALKQMSFMKAPLIADQEIDIKPVSWSPKELTFLRGREARMKEIVSAFGQTEALYSKNANRANIDGAIFLWEEYEITSKLTRIEQKLNEKLVPMYNQPRLFVAFDPVVADDKEFVLKQQEVDLNTQVKSINEVRAERALPPAVWGEVPLVNNTIVPLGSQVESQGTNEQGKASTIATTSKARLLPGKHIHTCDCGEKWTKDGKDAFDPIHWKSDIDRDLTGGANFQLKNTEKEIIAGLQEVWLAQFALALPQIPKGVAADFAWVASETWAREIVALTSEAIKEEVVLGGKLADRTVGITITDFIDRPDVQDAIRNHNFEFARAVNNTTADALKQQMLRGTTLGESIPELTKRVQSVFGMIDPKTGKPIDMDRAVNWRAERIARSESARANSLGEIAQWKETGVVVAKQWDAQNDACPFCRDMEGKTVSLTESFWDVEGPNQTVEFKGKEITLKHDYLDVKGPPLHPNCVTAETAIFAPDKLAGLIASYTGPIVQITLANGTRLSVTPNHMLMTSNGFVHAQFITKGYDVLYSTGFKGIVPGNPNDNGNPARIDNVVKTLTESGFSPTIAVPMAPEYLHGDAVFINGDINIIRADSGLISDGSSLPQCFGLHNKIKSHVGKASLDRADDLAKHNGSGDLASMLKALTLAADCTVGSSRETLAFRCAREFHSVEHSLATSAGRNACLEQSVLDYAAGTPERIGELLNGFTGLIERQKIVDVNVDIVSTHVYDLHCLGTSYIANGVLSSNCRCGLKPVLIET